MKKLMKKRTGFTLVELLIVIIIIGILAGAMLLVAGSGQDKAEATKIVSNLRSLKAGALMFWADNPNGPVNGIDDLKKYMDREITAPQGAKYVFEEGEISGDTTGGWFVGLNGVANTYPSDGVQEKLAPLAAETGLLADNKQVVSTDVYESGVNIYMRAR